MSTKLYLGTRKGLIHVERGAGGWEIKRTSFLGVPVPMLLPDSRDGRLIAAVEHGHYGGKLHASGDDGTTWTEIAVPVYPQGEEPVICAMSQKPIPQSQAGAMNRVCYGAVRCRVHSSNPPTAALAGKSWRACGTAPREKNGSVAAWTGRAFIPSASILATAAM
jgi:hypothetical protein